MNFPQKSNQFYKSLWFILVANSDKYNMTMYQKSS